MKEYDTRAYGLPEDIKRFIKGCRAKKLLHFALILVFCSVVLWYYRAEIFPFWLSVRRGILFTVLVVSPFAFTRVPFCFIDSNWRGEVTDIKLHMGGGIGGFFANGRGVVRAGNRSVAVKTVDGGEGRRPMSKYTVAVTVKRQDGSVKRVKVNTFGKTMADYKLGDTVIHFKGIKDLLIISKRDDGILNCIVCGCNNPKTRDKCFGCGHTLLKEYDPTDEDRRYS